MPDPPSLNLAKIDTVPFVAAGLNLDQYIGLWAIEPGHFQQLLATAESLDIKGHMAANEGTEPSAITSYAASGDDRDAANVAVINISGTMTKRGSSMSGAGSMTRLRREVRMLADDASVDAIMLVIDSPGGTMAGTTDLGEAVADAAGKKHVVAFVEDLAASAAYWVASQATEVIANNKSARVGSIGVFIGTYDASAKAELEGIEAVVIKTGPLKGAGFPGAPITEEQRADWQALVDRQYVRFKAVIQSGRPMTAEQVEAAATGGVFDAEDAMRMGLIDRIQSFESTLASLQATLSSRKRKDRQEMAYADIVAACEGIDESQAEDTQFICDQLKRDASPESASKAWSQTLKARADMAREEAANAKADAEKAKAEAAKSNAVPGVDPLEEDKGGSAYNGTAREEFGSRVESKMKAGMSRYRAVSAVSAADPDLRKAFDTEANESRKS